MDPKATTTNKTAARTLKVFFPFLKTNIYALNFFQLFQHFSLFFHKNFFHILFLVLDIQFCLFKMLVFNFFHLIFFFRNHSLKVLDCKKIYRIVIHSVRLQRLNVCQSYILLKFIYSEKATKFYKIFP